MKKIKLPAIKKNIKAFLTSEEGKISKKSVLELGTSIAVLGFMLADTISSWFSKDENITFDISIKHRKYYSWGTNLISTSHGDGAKVTDMPLLMASEEPLKWSKSKFRYIYLHHYHHKKQIKWISGKDYQGVTVEYLRSPSEADGWHDRNGFTAVPKAIEGFIHSKDNGQVARITHYF